MTIRFRAFVPVVTRGLALLVAILPTSASASVSHSAAAIHQRSNSLVAQIASSDLAVGRNRLTFGIIANNHPIGGGTPHLQYFYLRGKSYVPAGSGTADFNYFSRGLRNNTANSGATAIKGVYVSYVTFPFAGQWGVVIRMTYKGRTRVLNTGFTVAAHSTAPAVGSPAIRSNNPTIRQKSVLKLDSGRPPDDMHALSIAGAIAQHKPLVVLFSTPAFCESRMCGPQTEIVQGVERRYRGRVNFIHIEVYQNANPRYGYAPTLLQWHLRSEPWVFVIDHRGIIRARFDGPTSSAEILAAVNAVLRA